MKAEFRFNTFLDKYYAELKNSDVIFTAVGDFSPDSRLTPREAFNAIARAISETSGGIEVAWNYAGDTDVYPVSWKGPDRDYQTLLKLVTEASDVCAFREHRMKWKLIPGRNLVDGECVTCGKSVLCNPNPPPNGIDIGGEAVALNCDRPSVTIEVTGGVADLTTNQGDVNVKIIDWDLLENGCCPMCGRSLTPRWVSEVNPLAGQIAATHEEIIGTFVCDTCGWKEDE